MGWQTVALICAFSASVGVAPAFAQDHDTLKFTFSTSLAYDSNILRLADGASPPPALGIKQRSDFISVSSLGLRVDKPLSQQRFQFELSETIYRYQNYSFLDFDAFNYRAAWLWHVTPQVSGTVGAERRKSLVPFQEFSGFQAVIRTTHDRFFTLDAAVGGGWHMLLGASSYESRDSRPILAERSYEAVTAEGGIKYLARSGSSVALVQRSIKGDYIGRQLDPIAFVDTGFRETQSEATLNWIATGKSTLRGRLSSIERRHEHFAQRDFSGMAGAVRYKWAPTGKLRVNLGASRDFNAWWDSTSSYRVSDTVTAAGTWQMSAKAALVVQLDRINRDFRGAVAPFSESRRQDVERSALVHFEWNPVRAVTLRTAVQRLSRSSNVPAFAFQANMAEIVAAFSF